MDLKKLGKRWQLGALGASAAGYGVIVVPTGWLLGYLPQTTRGLATFFIVLIPAISIGIAVSKAAGGAMLKLGAKQLQAALMDAAVPPKNVRLEREYGEVIPLSTVLQHIDDDGDFVWTVQIPMEYAMEVTTRQARLRYDEPLPPKTVIMVGATQHLPGCGCDDH